MSLDSIGALVEKKANFHLDCNEEEFRRTTTKAYQWVPQFFRSVKSKYDYKQASFVFLTDKPMHFAINTPIAQDIKYRALEKNVCNDEELALKLSKDETKEFIKSQWRSEDEKKTFLEKIDKLTEKEFAESEWWKIGKLTAAIE